MSEALTIDFNEIDNLLEYDETSKTCLRWKTSQGTRAIAGTEAGSIRCTRGINSAGVTINKKRYCAHRIIWLLHNKNIDQDLEIDHIDGDTINNNIRNLRLVTRVVNQRNRKMKSTNTTGVTGVSYNKAIDSYSASGFDINSDRILKYFSCKKLGKDRAFEMACEFRRSLIEQINSEAGHAGYTDRHGK